MSDEIDSFELNGNGDETAPQPPPGGGNKTFLIAFGILGGLFVISLVGIAVFALIYLPQNQAQRNKQIAMINAANTATVAALTAAPKAIVPPAATATQEEQAVEETPLPTVTLKPTLTPVMAVSAFTNTPTVVDARTATVAALLTQAAQAKLTATYQVSATTQSAAGGATSGTAAAATPTRTTTALPRTGFAEDVGIPGLLGLAALFLVVIFLARRLRSSTPA